MQGWYYGKGLIYYRPIFQLTKLAFLRARVKPNLVPRAFSLPTHFLREKPWGRG